MAVIHGIVKSFGGSVTVDSSPGKGATFTVFLPVQECTQLIKAGETGSLPRGRERILVVDDEPLLARSIKAMLEHPGYQADCRTNGVEALEAFRYQPDNRPFDLVMTDMTMPHLTGAELAGELLRIDPHLPIIRLTGLIMDRKNWLSF